jgi:hypothetical protein
MNFYNFLPHLQKFKKLEKKLTSAHSSVDVSVGLTSWGRGTARWGTVVGQRRRVGGQVLVFLVLQ